MNNRRVLVTSKGEPATEVLRAKLPVGIREMCVSLGSGDTASFRRLEGAVEHLANHVAAVSVLLFTVTFYANLAHSLTRSPSHL